MYLYESRFFFNLDETIYKNLNKSKLFDNVLKLFIILDI